MTRALRRGLGPIVCLLLLGVWPAQAAKRFQAESFTLSNGLRVAVIPNPAALLFFVVGAPENLVGAHSVTPSGG